MKVILNLLPDKEKQREKEAKITKSALAISFSFVFFAIILVLGFFGLQQILKIEYEAAKIENSDSQGDLYSRTENLEKFLKEINLRNQQIIKINSESLNWYDILQDIAKEIPADIKITQLKIDKNSLKITGFSKTRQDYISFENVIKNKPYLENVKTPVSNLVSANDFFFNIEADVNKDKVKKDR